MFDMPFYSLTLYTLSITVNPAFLACFGALPGSTCLSTWTFREFEAA